MIVITESELVQGLQQYERAMIELSVLLRVDKWTDVGIAFCNWSQHRPESWQVLYIESKHYIAKYGVAPWCEP